MVQSLVLAGVSFLQNSVGLATRPYETYRRLVSRGSWWELVYLALVGASYFATAATVRTAAFRPFLLTRQFLTLGSGAIALFCLAVFIFWTVGTLLGAKGSLKGVMLGWAYTLVPTMVWFWVTSLLYIIVPPPRTTSVLGIVFSVLYLLFCVTLLFWKMTLSYLTLRFGLKLDLVKILAVSTIAVPILVLYSVVLYRFGVFRIPFL